MAYNSQLHRSIGIAPLELVIPRQLPNLAVRNLPPGTSIKPRGTLSDGSPFARKREFLAKLRVRIPAVVEALRKTQQRYKRYFDANRGKRNDKIKIGDYVYTTNHERANRLDRKAIGPFIVVDANESTFVVDIDGIEKCINSNHATTEPVPADAKDDAPLPLLDVFDKPRAAPVVHAEFVIDKLLRYRKCEDSYEFTVRWYEYTAKDDT